MIVWQHWSILLLAFLFPNTTILTQYNMALTQEQISTINAANEKFKTLKNYCKENNIDLNTLLSGQEKQQMKEGVAFLKEFLPQVKAAGIVQQVAMDGEDAIPKGAFVRTVKAQLDSLNQSEELIKIQGLTKYSIDSTILDAALKDIKLNTPFGKLFRSEILNGIKGAKTVADVVDVINNLTGKYGVNKFLKEHYNAKENKGYYKQEDIYIPILEGDLTRFTHRILDCITTAIDDPTYPPNQEKAAQLAKEKAVKEKELAADIAKFKQVYADWMVKQEEICSGIISSDTKTDSVYNISKKIFLAILIDKSNIWLEAQPELTEELRNSIAVTINKEDSSTIKDFVLAISNSLNNIRTPKDVLYRNWKRSPDLPSFYGLKTAIIAASSGTSTYDLSAEYMDWASTVGGAIDSLKVSEGQQFETEKLLKELKGLLVELEVAFFYPVFKQKLEGIQKRYPITKEVSRVWQTTLYDVIVNSQAISDQFEGIKGESRESFVKGLGKRLETIASLDTIKRVFETCKRPVVKKKALANGIPLFLTLTLNDGTILTNTISTEIVRMNGKQICVVPKGSRVSATSGDWGYDFESTGFFPQSPIEDGKEVITTYFQFKIEFSKGRGSVATGTETTSEYGTEGGWEKSVNEVEMKNWNNVVHGETTVSSGSLTKVFVDGEVTGGYAREWGGEKGTETTNGTFGSLSHTKGSASSTEKTTDEGSDTGFILVKGCLRSYDYNKEEGTMKVDVDVRQKDLSSPNSKGFKPSDLSMSTDEKIIWRK